MGAVREKKQVSEELYEYLINHEPTEQDAKEFWASVRELEKQFAETTKALKPTVNDRNRLFII